MPAPVRAAKYLEPALLFTIVAHGLAMLTMGTLLLPAMPGGFHSAIADRAAYVAGHPWLWRIGWLGWQVTALSDLLLAVALVCTPWIGRTPAWLALIATILGLVPDQYGQAIWTWPGVRLAQAAVAQHNLGGYLAFESNVFRLIAGWGTTGYLAAALAWTWCFASAGTWSRDLTRLSIATWGLFAASTAFIFLPPTIRPPGWLTSAGNALAFVLLMVWLIVVAELVLRRSRPDSGYGHWAMWRHPSSGVWARAADLIGSSRLVRYAGEHLHALAMRSDIMDVVYINYLLAADRLESLVPPGLQLQRVGPEGKGALFSILIYRHGHFGPSCFGSLRRIWPSPIQSNWRIYVIDPTTQNLGVHFITTTMTSTPHALATRLLCEGVPMHVPRRAAVDRDSSGCVHIELNTGTGTAPDLQGNLSPLNDAPLPASWISCFGTWREMLAYCVPQDKALSPQPWYGRIARQEISLGIRLEDCQPLGGQVCSKAADAIVGSAEAVCFLVDRVRFEFLGEAFDNSAT